MLMLMALINARQRAMDAERNIVLAIPSVYPSSLVSPHALSWQFLFS